MDGFEEKAKKAAVENRAPMDEGRRKAMRQAFLGADDLMATCQLCGTVVKGTLQHLTDHPCARNT